MEQLKAFMQHKPGRLGQQCLSGLTRLGGLRGLPFERQYSPSFSVRAMHADVAASRNGCLVFKFPQRTVPT
eukprot:3204529-Rhodomonas_salina.1